MHRFPTAHPHVKLQKLFPARSLRQAACNPPSPCEITESPSKWDLKQRSWCVFSRGAGKQLNTGLTFIRWWEAELQRDANCACNSFFFFFFCQHVHNKNLISVFAVSVFQSDAHLHILYVPTYPQTRSCSWMSWVWLSVILWSTQLSFTTAQHEVHELVKHDSPVRLFPSLHSQLLQLY